LNSASGSSIFNGLQAAQAVLAVLIFRVVENERKRPDAGHPPSFLPYASHYLAMLVGEALLEAKGLSLTEVDHRKLPELVTYLQENQVALYQQATAKVQSGLEHLYGSREVSLQQLSATFRRGDLLEFLN
jgi:hypothetical protein